MSGLLGHRQISPEDQRDNDKHRTWVVVATLAALAFFAYLCTDLGKVLGIGTPRGIANALGIEGQGVFDQNGALRTNLYLPGQSKTGTYQHSYNPRDLLLLFGLWGIAFISSYYLKLARKGAALVICCLAGLLWLVGFGPTAGFVGAHIVQYCLYHPRANHSRTAAALPGFLAVVAFGPDNWSLTLSLSALAAGALGWVLYSFAVHPALLRFASLARVLRIMGSQAAGLTLLIGVLVGVFRGSPWTLPFALLLFFFHWHRSILYHIDFTDKRVPENLSLTAYLAIFFNPATLAGFAWSPYIGQGYAYTSNALLRQNKNRIVLSGIAFIGTGFLFLLAHRWLSQVIDQHGATVFGQLVFIRIEPLLDQYAKGGPVGTISVLMTTMFYVVGWMCMWASVTRVKIGLWRIFGYDFDAHFNQPWKATNLTTLWARFAFHYREFLVKGFYYPVLFRFKWAQKFPQFRKFAAIIAAATLGNMFWGHGIEELYYSGLNIKAVVGFLPKWPYYLLLGLGIASADFYLRKRRTRRKPWTLGPRLATDVMAAYATAQYFALIHIFAYSSANSSSFDQWKLLLLGLGIDM